MWSIVATWPFSIECVEEGAKRLSCGGYALDAAEAGVQLVETNPAVDSVGRGGYLNENGELALDGAVMDGSTLRTGAAACVRYYEHPVSIARAVMEKTRHNILVGPAAEAFAEKVGFEKADPDYLITPEVRAKYEAEKAKKETSGHDTIGCAALDASGNICTACSTSGANLRMAGRVGDTPIIGSGFYALSGVGAACATGLGEDIMRTCLSFRAVELMRAGKSAGEAAREVIASAHSALKACGLNVHSMAVVCLDASGGTGGAANHKGFAYACAREGEAAKVVFVEPAVDDFVE
ncbi:MAG: isoaspartyl peptidase/L-asparaginase [Clostridia bacterium]|nr:isoaspartyl peptidase/L-asparaginase [Clostridia bacterium]